MGRRHRDTGAGAVWGRRAASRLGFGFVFAEKDFDDDCTGAGRFASAADWVFLWLLAAVGRLGVTSFDGLPNRTMPWRVSRPLRWTLFAAVGLLLSKTFAATLMNYRDYFPVNFDADFLIGRRQTFTILYQTLFYTHIITAPGVLLAMTALMVQMNRPQLMPGLCSRSHRWIGRATGVITLLLVVPSGLGMAFWAAAGPIAGWGFATQSMLVAMTMGIAVVAARRQRWAAHQRFMMRCYVLMLSPMLLRIAGGLCEVLTNVSNTFNVVNAWASWLTPWLLLEAYWFWGKAKPTRSMVSNRMEVVL